MEGKKENIRDSIYELNERRKELNCLYEVKQILRDTNAPVDQIFEDIINVIPDGWQFPEICTARIQFEGMKYKSREFRETEYSQSSLLYTDKLSVGKIEVFYKNKIGSEDNDVFLREEYKLLDAIADEINQYLTLRRFQQLLRASDSQIQDLDIPTGLARWLGKMGLSGDEIRTCVNNKVTFKKGETIFKQGSQASYVLTLTRGLMKASVEDLNERSFAFKIFTAYDFIGLSSLFGDESHNYSVHAIQGCEGYLIKKIAIINMIKKNPKFNISIHSWYNEHFNLLHNKLNILANKHALGRVANTLLYLSGEIFKATLVDKTITRKNIAELSGMSMENAVRILSELKTDDIITITNQGIEIKKPELLKTFSIAG